MESRSRAGFVLAGGRSSRMGRDKALLVLDGGTLLERIAGEVRRAAGSVTVIGQPARYGLLGLPCVADLVEGCGPLGGLYTALSTTTATWNLVVACDMPRVDAGLFAMLFDAAGNCGRLALVPTTGGGFQPLCAVYHRDLLPAVSAAVAKKSLKMHDFVSTIDAYPFHAPDPTVFSNVNTPEEWAEVRV